MKTRITLKNFLLAGLMSFLFFPHAKGQGYGSNLNQDNGLNEKPVSCDSAVDQNWNGQTWSTSDIVAVQLTAGGLPVKERVYDSTGKYEGYIEITRDANNRATSLIVYTIITGTPVKEYEEDLAYNTNGWVTQQTYYSTNETDKNFYTYDGSGKTIVKKYQYVDLMDTSNKGGTLDSFFYNSSNLMVKDISYNLNGSAYELNSVYTETYNANGKITNEKETFPGQADYFYFTDYTYNAAGNEVLLKSGQSNTGTVTYDNKDTFTYGSNGALSFTTQYTNSNGIWAPESRNGCLSGTAGIAPVKSTLAFSVYPNPTRGNIEIQYTSPADETANIRIVDMQGRQVYCKQVQFSAYNVANIETSTMPGGIYFITAENDNGVYTQKLVVIK